MSELATMIVSITGRVQGVCFRAETRRAAIALGVSGYVKNMPDGSVQALFQAEKPVVDRMIEWCWKGSPYSAVDGVAVESVPASEDLTGFDIRWA